MMRWTPTVALVAFVVAAAVVGVAAGQAGVFLVDPQSQTVTEEGVNAQVTVIRLSGSSGTVSVDYTTVDGSATAGADYYAAAGTLTWTDGDTTPKIINVGLIDDSVFEPRESFVFSISNPTNGASLGAVTSSTIDIDLSDQNAGTLSLDKTTYAATEGGLVQVLVLRSGGADGEISVSYQTLDGTATSPADFTAVSGVLTWPNGDSSARTVSITIQDDTDFELTEQFSISLSNFQGGAAVGTSDAPITIATSDQDAGSIGFDTASATVPEDAGLITIDVSRTGGSDGPVSVNFVAIDVSTTLSLDYTITEGALEWPSGDATTRTIRITIIDDSVYEPNTEELRIRLQDPQGGVTIDSSAASFSVFIDGPNDQVPGVIAFQPSEYVVDESAGSITTLLTRTGGADGEVSVSVTTADFEALAGSDYVAVTQTLTWVNGESGVKGVVVSILDDAIFEPNEVFTLRASSPTGGVGLANDTAQVTIARSDQQGGIINLVSTLYTVDENVGAIQIQVERASIIADGAVSVRYRTVDDTAIGAASFLLPGDYFQVSGDLSWGDKDNATRSVFLIINDDSEYEPLESFTFELFDVTGGATLGSAVATIQINGNDLNPGYIAFGANGAACPMCSLSVAESAGTLRIPVKRIDGFNAPASVSYSVTALTAAPVQDYIDVSGILSWANGDAADKFINVPIVDDDIFEADESFRVVLSSPVTAALGSHDNTTVTIVGPNDQQGGVIGFSVSAVTVVEEDGSVAVNVVREGARADGDASVVYTVVAGTALNGTDMLVSSGLLSWTHNDATARTIVVPLINDDVYELDEFFTVVLSSYVGGGSLGNSSATITIGTSDQKGGIIHFDTPLLSVAESAGAFFIDVHRTNGTDGPATVSYRAVDGMGASGATANQDYIFAEGTLSWPSGDASPKTISGVILDDSNYEAVSELFTIELYNATTGTALGSPSTASILIEGPNDFIAGEIGFLTNTLSVVEEAGTISIRLVREGGTDGTVLVSYSVQAGTAERNIDYVAGNGTVGFVSGSSTGVITIPIIDDAVYERVETLTVELFNPTGGAGLLSGRTTATVFIFDDADRSPGTLSIGCSTFAVDEDAGTLDVVVERTDGSDGFVSIDVVVANGTAYVGYDVVPTELGGVARYALNWTDLDTAPKTFSIGIIDDSVYEIPEVFYLSFENAQGRPTFDASASVEVYIKGPNDLENEVPAALRSQTVTKDKSSWEWVGPLAVGVALLLLLLVCVFLALCIMYMRSSREPIPVAVDRHEVVVDPLQPAHKTEVLAVEHTRINPRYPDDRDDPYYDDDRDRDYRDDRVRHRDDPYLDDDPYVYDQDPYSYDGGEFSLYSEFDNRR